MIVHLPGIVYSGVVSYIALVFVCFVDNIDGKSLRRSKSSYEKKKEITEEDDREDEELDWSHTVSYGIVTLLFSLKFELF